MLGKMSILFISKSFRFITLYLRRYDYRNWELSGKEGSEELKCVTSVDEGDL